MDLGKHVYDVASGYSVWRMNRVKDMVLSPIDDIMVQLASLLSKKVPTKVELLRSEFKSQRKMTNQKKS